MYLKILTFTFPGVNSFETFVVSVSISFFLDLGLVTSGSLHRIVIFGVSSDAGLFTFLGAGVCLMILFDNFLCVEVGVEDLEF